MKLKHKAQARADEADTRAYQQSHPGLSSDFSAKIAEILRQGKQAEQRYRDSAEGKLPAKTMGEIAQERMATIPKDQAWRRQNPFAEGMGYQWADDKTLQGLGWKDDDISSMKARTEFDPQEIQNLYSVGALKAPYAEYLKNKKPCVDKLKKRLLELMLNKLHIIIVNLAITTNQLQHQHLRQHLSLHTALVLTNLIAIVWLHTKLPVVP